MKNTKNSLRIIIAMILTIVMIGSSFAFADSPNEAGQPLSFEVQSEQSSDDANGLRSEMVRTYFDANGGYCAYSYIDYMANYAYGFLPTPYKAGYEFIGWFEYDATDETNEYTENTIAMPTVLKAHWGEVKTIYNVGAGRNLNIYGSNLTSLSNGINVTTWTSSGSNEQKWIIDMRPQSNIAIRSIIDRNYGLNVYRAGSPWNCNVHTVVGNETDAMIDLVYITDSYYLIKLHNYNLYLTADGAYDGSNVYWTSYSGSNYQVWMIY